MSHPMTAGGLLVLFALAAALFIGAHRVTARPARRGTTTLVRAGAVAMQLSAVIVVAAAFAGVGS